MTATAKGRKATCSCCGTRVIVRAGQEWRWRAATADASLLIVEAHEHGAIVVQVGREAEPPWTIRYDDLLGLYRRIGFA